MKTLIAILVIQFSLIAGCYRLHDQATKDNASVVAESHFECLDRCQKAGCQYDDTSIEIRKKNTCNLLKLLELEKEFKGMGCK